MRRGSDDKTLTIESSLPLNVTEHPSTGVQWAGKKQRLLPEIVARLGRAKTVYEPFTGSATVGLALRNAGKTVIANDFLSCSYVIAKATVGNPGFTLDQADVEMLLSAKAESDFLTREYGGHIFLPRDTQFLDRLAWGVVDLPTSTKQAMAMAAGVRAIIKGSSYGRFNVGLDKHLTEQKLPKHEKRRLEDLFLESVDHFNRLATTASGPVGRVYNRDVFSMPRIDADAAYIDPPYPTTRRQSSYEYAYHLPEIFVNYGETWPLAECGRHQKRKTSVFSLPCRRLYPVFKRLFEHVEHIRTLVISHATHCWPTVNQLVTLLRRQGRRVTWSLFPAHYARSVWSKHAQPQEILITARKR